LKFERDEIFMKALKQCAAVIAAALLLLSPCHAHAQQMTRYKASPIGSKVRIDGTSNIHDWTMDGQIIAGYIDIADGTVLDPSKDGPKGGVKIPASAEISIPVTSMKSGTTGMDEVMQEAMNATACPRIVYHLKEMRVKGTHTAGTPLEFDTKGDLAIAGVTNQISMPIRIESAEKKLKVVGANIPLKMTDYKIKPPVKLGVFKTVDDIKISFEWEITPPASK
jgi:hypothetical protein